MRSFHRSARGGRRAHTCDLILLRIHIEDVDWNPGLLQFHLVRFQVVNGHRLPEGKSWLYVIQVIEGIFGRTPLRCFDCPCGGYWMAPIYPPLRGFLVSPTRLLFWCYGDTGTLPCHTGSSGSNCTLGAGGWWCWCSGLPRCTPWLLEKVFVGRELLQGTEQSLVNCIVPV